MAIKTIRQWLAPPRHPRQGGFALLISIIFMSVMLMFGLALGSLGYKQTVLASSSVESQYAFYAADAALECALQADQQQNLFMYTSDMTAPAPVLTCNGIPAVSSTVTTHTASKWIISSRLSLDGGKRCADVMVSQPNSATGGTAYLYAQGYDVPCATVSSPSGARFASRGVSTSYSVGVAPVAPPPAAVPTTPTFVATAFSNPGYTTGVANYTLNYPAAAAAGDVMVLFVNHGLSSPAVPTGWTPLSVLYPTSLSYGYGVYTKVKATETAVNFSTWNGGAHLIVYRGSSGIGAVGSWLESANGSTAVLPGITPQSTASLVVGYLSDRDVGACSPSAGWATRTADNLTYFCTVAADKAFNSTAPTGNQVWNAVFASYPAVGVLVEVKP